MTPEAAGELLDKYNEIALNCRENNIQAFGMFHQDMEKIIKAGKVLGIIKEETPDKEQIGAIQNTPVLLQTIEDTGVRYYTRYKIKEFSK